MTSEILSCCCGVSPCPCFALTGGYRVTWTGVVAHYPVTCSCLLNYNIPPNYSGSSFTTYTLRDPFISGIPSFDRLWLQPSTGNPTPCQFVSPSVVFGSQVPIDEYEVGSGGYCSGPTPVPLSAGAAAFTASIGLQPYQPTLNLKWRVTVNPRPFKLIYQSDDTTCNPTGFYLISSTVDPFQIDASGQPSTLSCHGNATLLAIVSSQLMSEGTVSLLRI